MSKLITDFTSPQRMSTSTANLSPENWASTNTFIRATSLARFGVVMAGCLLAQGMTFVTLANAEDFELIGDGQSQIEEATTTPSDVVAPVVDDQSPPAPSDLNDQSQPASSNPNEQSTHVSINQSGNNEQSWGQTYNQDFDTGVEQVSYEQAIYDAQYNSSVYGPVSGLESGQVYGQVYGQEMAGGEIAGEVVGGDVYSQYNSSNAYDTGQSYNEKYEAPSTQAYSSYSGTTTPSQSYGQTYTSSASSSGNVQPGLAQQKATQAAQGGIQGHLGGGLGGAKYEGVGWSNRSAQNAIQSCCYWGTRPTAQIGVSKGSNGFWYACVLYY